MTFYVHVFSLLAIVSAPNHVRWATPMAVSNRPPLPEPICLRVASPAILAAVSAPWLSWIEHRIPERSLSMQSVSARNLAFETSAALRVGCCNAVGDPGGSRPSSCSPNSLIDEELRGWVHGPGSRGAIRGGSNPPSRTRAPKSLLRRELRREPVSRGAPAQSALARLAPDWIERRAAKDSRKKLVELWRRR